VLAAIFVIGQLAFSAELLRSRRQKIFLCRCSVSLLVRRFVQIWSPSGGFLFPTQESCLLVVRVPFCLVSRADFAARSFLLLILLPSIKGNVCGRSFCFFCCCFSLHALLIREPVLSLNFLLANRAARPRSCRSFDSASKSAKIIFSFPVSYSIPVPDPRHEASSQSPQIFWVLFCYYRLCVMFVDGSRFFSCWIKRFKFFLVLIVFLGVFLPRTPSVR
jgi:hypothetical protein